MAARYLRRFSLWPSASYWLSCSMAFFTIVFACSTFMFVLLFGSFAPFTDFPREQSDQTEDKSGERAAFQVGTGCTASDTGFWLFGGASRASGDRRRDVFHAGNAAVSERS